MENNHVIEFDEELYYKNIEENEYPEQGEFGGLSEYDLKELKKEGLM